MLLPVVAKKNFKPFVTRDPFYVRLLHYSLNDKRIYCLSELPHAKREPAHEYKSQQAHVTFGETGETNDHNFRGITNYTTTRNHLLVRAYAAHAALINLEVRCTLRLQANGIPFSRCFKLERTEMLKDYPLPSKELLHNVDEAQHLFNCVHLDLEIPLRSVALEKAAIEILQLDIVFEINALLKNAASSKMPSKPKAMVTYDVQTPPSFKQLEEDHQSQQKALKIAQLRAHLYNELQGEQHHQFPSSSDYTSSHCSSRSSI